MEHAAFRNLVDEIKRRTDVVELIGRDVDLRPSGSHLVGSSPWNRDSTPSFVVWPDSQRWMDYSGGGSGGGDCVTYVQRRNGAGFMEALRELAGRAGVALPNGSSADAAKATRALVERRRVEDLLAIAATYYHRGLPSKIRREWLHERYGFSDETVDRWLIGWANGHLLEHLKDVASATTEEALSTGLFVQLRGGRVVDLFCNRIVFPYWRHGRVCYFIARRTEHTGDEAWEQAKYKKLLTRSDRHAYVSEHVRNGTFYGEDSVRGASEIVITEGITDAIAVLQSGMAVQSPVTVRFRKQDHEKLITLTARAERVVICNDNEESGAGEAGAMETARALHEAGRDVRIALIPRPEGKDKIDVNELVATQGGDALREVIDSGLRYPEYLLQAIPEDTPKQDLDKVLRPVMEAVVGLAPIERHAYRDLIARHFGLNVTPVGDRLRQVERELGRAQAQARIDASGRPSITMGGRQLSEVLAEAGIVLSEANEQLIASASCGPIPSSEAAPLFVRGGRLVRVDTSRGNPAVAELEDVEVYGLLARVADWYLETPEGPVPASPIQAVSRDMLAYPPSELPALEDVVATPIFGADGGIIDRPGYHEAERLWLHRDSKLVVAPVPKSPSHEEVARARSLLLDELFGDFCFVEEADRTHALAALLLPFTRRLVDGFTPLHLVEAPTPGSGKGLLCNLISIVATGRPCESRAVPTTEDEIRKMITAELTKAQPIVLLDNLPEKRTLESSALAALLTSDPWTDRVLGESRMVSLPNRALWLATGNNPSLTDEMARRCIRIRLDTREEMPWQRRALPAGDSARRCPRTTSPTVPASMEEAMSDNLSKSRSTIGRPRKAEGPRVPYNEVDRLLVFGEVAPCADGETSDVRFPSYREIAARYGVSHSLIAHYSKRHDCLRRRDHNSARIMARAEQKLVELRATAMAYSRDDELRLIDSFLLGFEQALAEGRVRLDDPSDFNLMVRLKAFIQGGADSRHEVRAAFSLEELQARHREMLRAREESGTSLAGQSKVEPIRSARVDDRELDGKSPDRPPAARHEEVTGHPDEGPGT